MSTGKKIVLVTGCSKGGIGYALCEEYARQGCKVYATARRLESMATFLSPNIEKLTLDVMDDVQVRGVVQTVIEKEGRIDVLVNNAGANCGGAIADVPLEVAQRTFDTNFYAVIRTFKAIFPHMAARKSGTIVNIGSIVGEFPTAWNGIYAASKAALHRLCDVLYLECQPFNINIVCVAPGGVKSNIADTQLKAGISMPENSLYKAYTQSIVDRILASQGPKSISAEQMASLVVTASLAPSPPRYVSMGASSVIFKIFAWLPKTWVLNFLWRRLRGNPKIS